MGERIDERSRITPYRRCEAGSQPSSLWEPYRSSVRRAPSQPLILLPHTLSEVTGPVYGHGNIGDTDNDLTRQHSGEPLGERIIITGRVLDSNGRPVPRALIELWQADSARPYGHPRGHTSPAPRP